MYIKNIKEIATADLKEAAKLAVLNLSSVKEKYKHELKERYFEIIDELKKRS